MTAVTARRAPGKQSLHDKMTNDAFRWVGGLAVLAEPSFHQIPTALAACRLYHCRLLVHLADRRNPTHVDDLCGFVPHLMTVQKVDVRLQPIFGDELINREVIATIAEAD